MGDRETQPTVKSPWLERHPQGGLLVLDKPVGPTSHDVVAHVRRVMKTREVGHTGTLDPFASGVLVVLLGQLTRAADLVGDGVKRYLATARLGVETNTDDATGTPVVQHDVAVTRAQVEAALPALTGEIAQVPPAFSAKHVDGQRAYALARAGDAPVLKPVNVTVFALTVVEMSGVDVVLDVTCSKGTYVRALARDLGRALGVGAHLTALRRTVVGPFVERDAVPVAQMTAEHARPASWMLNQVPCGRVDDAGLARVLQGRTDVDLQLGALAWPAGAWGMVAHQQRLLALAHAKQELPAQSAQPGSMLAWGRRFPTAPDATP